MSTSGCITDLKPSQPTSQESMQPRRLPVAIQPTSKPSRQSTRQQVQLTCQPTSSHSGRPTS